MKTIQRATRSRANIAACFLSCLLFITPVESQAAVPSSLLVKISQPSQGGETQQITCSLKKKCLLPISIFTSQGQRETLSVHVLLGPGAVLFEFETPQGYLYAADKASLDSNATYETIWHKSIPADKPSTNDVTLFLPSVPHAELAPIVRSVQTAVVDLQITMENAQ